MEKRILILPYRRLRRETEYLIRREHVDKWDEASDICAISMPVGNYTLEEAALHALEATSGFDGKEKDLIRLGIVMADRKTTDVIHLFAIDLSERSGESLPAHYDESGEMTYWAKPDDLMKSIDAGLLAAFARVNFLGQQNNL